MKNSFYYILPICGIIILLSYQACKSSDKEKVMNKQEDIRTYRLQESDSIAEVNRKNREETEKQYEIRQKENERKLKEAKENFYNLPLISQEEEQGIKPLLRRWLIYGNLDLSEARFVRHDTININIPSDKGSVYYREFTSEYDSPSLIQMVYSPNKQLYIDLEYHIKRIGNKYYFDSDSAGDGQTVFLVDRKEKHFSLITEYGLGGHLDDAFWKNKDTFIICGYEYDFINKGIILIFDLKNNTRKRYEIEVSEEQLEKIFEKEGYFNYFFKQKGITIHDPE